MFQWRTLPLVAALLVVHTVAVQVVRMSVVTPACQSLCTCHDGGVDCSGKGLTSVPDDLPGNMTSLNLSRNAIHDLPNHTFTRFHLLSVLDVSYNNISRLHVQAFVGLSSLTSLNLSWNALTLSHEAYPADVFTPLATSLSDLRLGGNAQKTDDPDAEYPDFALSVLKNLTYLVLDGFAKTNFGPGFSELHSLRNLSLLGFPEGYCSIPKLENSTFANLPSSLSLQGSNLEDLYINEIMDPYSVCVVIDTNHTRYFKDTRLQSIHAESNRIEIFTPGALDNMPDTLSFVSVSGNRLGFGSYFLDFIHLPNLKTVTNDGYLQTPHPPTSYPAFSVKPELCESSPYAHESERGCHRPLGSDRRAFPPWYPFIENDRLEGGDASTHISLTYFLPPNLTSYVSRWNQMHYKIVNIQFDENNTLTNLDLSNNLLAVWIGPFKGLNHLESFDLSNNFAHTINYTFFDTFPELKTLRLSRNYLRDPLMNDEQGRMFANLSKLESLDLSSNYINIIPAAAFQGLKNLRQLNLSHNDIFNFEITVSHMMSLTSLDLSYNNIHFIPKFITDHLDLITSNPNVTVYLNLTFNPIACLCTHIDFLTWIQQSAVQFVHQSNYSCLRPDGTVKKMTNIFDEIQTLQKTCGDFVGMLIGAFTCFFCLTLALASAVLYRFRWKLRYLYYASRLAHSRKRTLTENSFEVDAFVSYCSEDDEFVHGELVRQLEERKGLRLIVHHRDFTPGQPIPCNIVAAVQNSRHTLVVLTRHLLQSDWCQYEMQMATMESVHTGRNVLLFLLYEDIPSHELPRQVLYNIQSSTYIHFPHDHPELVPNFWVRLAKALKEQ
ncbi:hypothetical protein C0Q70_01080 [Pomacea canaliculata]|uniref:TIR domain-containing protein n=1 Tax=Pomacea canaliculata TaxID=400727 RepID=A0A2T7PYG0_POMCA|nr:hypothetical protein C0Q70_01080 [Pomacea canaliculata]